MEYYRLPLQTVDEKLEVKKENPMGNVCLQSMTTAMRIY